MKMKFNFTIFAHLFFIFIFFSIQEELNSKNSRSEIEVAANEDLMREHGILNRLLLVYQEIARRIDNHEKFDIQLLAKSSKIVRVFLEDYHEKLEEEYIFPKFEKAGKQPAIPAEHFSLGD